MPIERQHVDAIRVLVSHASEPRECHDCREEYQADNHVEPVQADQRVVGSAEEVRADRQPNLVNQPVPLPGGPEEKRATESNRREPPPTETSNVRTPESLDGEVNGEAAREQADGEEDGNFKSLPGHGSGQALADVVNVGDDEDHEYRRLACNEGEHADVTSGRRLPLQFLDGHRHWRRTHDGRSYSYFQSGSSGCLRSQSGRRDRP